MSMRTLSISKYITKGGSASDLQKALNDLSEQGYELVHVHMFMGDGLRYFIVMRR